MKAFNQEKYTLEYAKVRLTRIQWRVFEAVVIKDLSLVDAAKYLKKQKSTICNHMINIKAALGIPKRIPLRKAFSRLNVDKDFTKAVVDAVNEGIKQGIVNLPQQVQNNCKCEQKVHQTVDTLPRGR